MKKIFIVLTFIILIFVLFSPRHILANNLSELVQKEEIFVDINHSKQLDDDTDIDSILVMVDKTTVLNVDDFKNINVKAIKDLTDFSEFGNHVHREDCVHSNKELTTRILKVELNDGGKENILDAITKINDYDGIIYAEPNYKGSFFTNIPNDVSLTYDWYIQKIGLDKAWEISTGSSLVNVGVADTGIDGTHRDLTNRISTSLSNSFSTNSGTAMEPAHPHGTYVAGIIGAQGNNGYDSCGVNWNVSLVSLRIDKPAPYYDEDMGCLIQAINYANYNGIPIINFSGGFPNDSIILQSAVSGYAGLFICASGNDGDDIEVDGQGIYPAKYTYSNMITVSASTPIDEKASFSNYGATTVDLFAPGVSIRGSNMGNGVCTESGTSAAAPIVAGVAALLKSVNPSLTTAQLKNAILNNVDSIPALSNYCITGGRLNAFKALSSVVYSTTIVNGKLSINGFISGYSLNRIADLEIPATFALYNSSTSVQLEVGSISDYAFYNDGYLNKITIPSEVVDIGEEAFKNCSNITNITLPNNLQSLGNNAFEGCTSLASISIPSSVESIGSNAFKNCSSLSEVIIGRAQAPLTSLGSNAFSGCESSLQIKVPQDRIADYKNKVTWSGYSNKIIPHSNNYSTATLQSCCDFSFNATINAGYNKIYKINVNDQGTYKIKATSSYGKIVKLYDSNMTFIDSSTSSITETLDEDEIYFVTVEFTSTSTSGVITTTFKDDNHIHSYGAPYVWYNYTQHNETCSCGATHLQGHAVSGTPRPGQQYAICLICGGPASMGIMPYSINNLPYTVNGSYILPNGVVVLVDEDIDDYLYGMLVFINPGEYINRSSSIPYILKRDDEYLLD